jgi:hypothetical protein
MEQPSKSAASRYPKSIREKSINRMKDVYVTRHRSSTAEKSLVLLIGMACVELEDVSNSSWFSRWEEAFTWQDGS